MNLPPEVVNPGNAEEVATRKAANWALVVATLLEQPGVENIMDMGVVFKFSSWQAKTNALDAVRQAHPWAFFNTAADAALFEVPHRPLTITAGYVTFFSVATARLSTDSGNFFRI